MAPVLTLVCAGMAIMKAAAVCEERDVCKLRSRQESEGQG
jgi:hypothetical protein